MRIHLDLTFKNRNLLAAFGRERGKRSKSVGGGRDPPGSPLIIASSKQLLSEDGGAGGVTSPSEEGETQINAVPKQLLREGQGTKDGRETASPPPGRPAEENQLHMMRILARSLERGAEELYLKIKRMETAEAKDGAESESAKHTAESPEPTKNRPASPVMAKHRAPPDTTKHGRPSLEPAKHRASSMGPAKHRPAPSVADYRKSRSLSSAPLHGRYQEEGRKSKVPQEVDDQGPTGLPGRRFSLGQVARPEEMDGPSGCKENLLKVAQLREGDGAWVRRSGGGDGGSGKRWTFAVVKEFKERGTGITFVVDGR